MIKSLKALENGQYVHILNLTASYWIANYLYVWSRIWRSWQLTYDREYNAHDNWKIVSRPIYSRLARQKYSIQADLLKNYDYTKTISLEVPFIKMPISWQTLLVDKSSLGLSHLLTVWSICINARLYSKHSSCLLTCPPQHNYIPINLKHVNCVVGLFSDQTESIIRLG